MDGFVLSTRRSSAMVLQIGAQTWRSDVATICNAINMRFGPPIRSNPFGELMQLPTGGRIP